MVEKNTFIDKKWFVRLLTGALAGLLTWLLAEVLLNIRYRYFVMFLEPMNYLYAAFTGIFVRETLFRTGKMLDKVLLWDKSPAKRLLIQMLAGILIAFTWVSVIRLVIRFIFFQGTLIIFSDELVLLLLVIILISSYNLAEFAFFLNERYRKSLSEVERFRKENAEYQFEMLKLQLNPHFLFNSLNTLSSLVHEDPSKSAEFIRRLSDVYRYVLENRNKELVSLREEMEFIRSFTFLQELRFHGMIFFQFEVSEQVLDRKIAPMTMQLLVENAVKHNVASRKLPLQISIISGENEISVMNNLQPKDEAPGTGVGLKNIASRYAFLSERKIEIIKKDHLFKVIIPLI
jgi:two-component system, LytTR family, sensor kinase